MLWLTAVAALVLVSTVLGSLLLWFRRRYDAEGNELVDAVEGLLPHTQCAQCGYPGCRPYAEAVVDGAPLDLCPPGGEATFKALQDLLGKYEGTAPAEPAASIARLRATLKRAAGAKGNDPHLVGTKRFGVRVVMLSI